MRTDIDVLSLVRKYGLETEASTAALRWPDPHGPNQRADLYAHA
jgi:hypothetical protein